MMGRGSSTRPTQIQILYFPDLSGQDDFTLTDLGRGNCSVTHDELFLEDHLQVGPFSQYAELKNRVIKSPLYNNIAHQSFNNITCQLFTNKQHFVSYSLFTFI
jgi:hypothetical protein